jgi:hypothetical protein
MNTDLREECFSHGQLVTCGLLKRWFCKRLTYTTGAHKKKTTNALYKEVEFSSGRSP